MGDRLLLRKCINPDVKDEDGKVLIYLPDKSKDITEFCEILDIGPKCKEWDESHIGRIVRVVANGGNGINRVPGTECDYLVNEKWVETVIYG